MSKYLKIIIPEAGKLGRKWTLSYVYVSECIHFESGVS